MEVRVSIVGLVMEVFWADVIPGESVKGTNCELGAEGPAIKEDKKCASVL